MSKVSRNDDCPCGSGKKYKKCCMTKSSILKHKISVISSAPSLEGKAQKLSAGLFGKKNEEPSVENQSES